MAEHILSLSEIEVYISNLSTSKIENIGDLSWFECHKRLHMLYQEALLETINGENEQIKEAILLNGKMKLLVFEAISLSVWRHNVFPLLTTKYDFDKEKVFPIFVMLYHEATAFGLVESLSFHADCIESLGEASVELLDYCVACLLQMINRDVPRPAAGRLSELSSRDELAHYEADVVHNLAIKAVSVLRFISEASDSLPLSVTSRFYNNHDVPMLLCKVIELEPWFTTDLDGKHHEFIDGRWRRRGVERGADEALNKSAAQAWLSLRQVLLGPAFATHYDLNDFRSRHLCKLVCHLHDVMLDQLSPLAELKYWLCRLSVAPPAPTHSTRPLLILELDAQLRDALLRKYANRWESIAKKQATIITNLDISQIQSLAHGLARAYETLDLLEPEPARCANCGDPAAKRCSRCKAEWYCGRECQVKSWDKHKAICNTIAEAETAR